MSYKILDEVRYSDSSMYRVLNALGDRAFVAGGAARRAIMGEEAPVPEDIDVFLRRAQHHALVGKNIEDLGYKFEADIGSALVFLVEGIHNLRQGKPIQLILPEVSEMRVSVGNPVEVMDKFAFRTEQFAVYMSGDKVVGVHTTEAVNDTRERRLVINHVSDPVRVAWRAVKYGRKGYNIPQVDLYHLMEDWRLRSGVFRQTVFESLSEDGGSFG